MSSIPSGMTWNIGIGRPESDLMKQQQILVLSKRRQPQADLPVALRGRCRFTYCGGDDQSVVLASEQIQRRFDWILIDGAGMDGDEKEFLQSLRAIGLIFAEGEQSRACKVEWDANGVLQLCCARKQAAAGKRIASAAKAEDTMDGFVFEFHAPMERAG